MDDVRLARVLIDNRQIEGFATSVEAGVDRSEADLARQLRQVGQELGAGIPGDQSAAGRSHIDGRKWRIHDM